VVTNTLAYYSAGLITTVKSFIVLPPMLLTVAYVRNIISFNGHSLERPVCWTKAHAKLQL